MALGQFSATTRRLENLLAHQAELVILVERLRLAHERIGRTARAHLVAGDEASLDEMTEACEKFQQLAAELARRDREGGLATEIRVAVDLEHRYQGAYADLFAAREAKPDRLAVFQRTVQPLRRQLTDALAEIGQDVDERFRVERAAAAAAADDALHLVFAVAGVSLVVAIALTFAITRALTLLARSQAELQRSHDRLEVVNRDLDAFAGRIAHDLRNALGPLLVLTARLRRTSDPAALHRTADQFDALGRRAARLIDSLLAFARGTDTAGPMVGSVPDVVREAADDVAPLAAELSAAIHVDLEDVRVRCPPMLLYTVISNLVGNAVKFVAGRPRRDVRIVAHARDGRCEIAVSDTGPGIPPDWRARVFEPFVRVPGTARAAPASGSRRCTASCARTTATLRCGPAAVRARQSSCGCPSRPPTAPRSHGPRATRGRLQPRDDAATHAIRRGIIPRA
jgi:signal transduction histidine kinase